MLLDNQGKEVQRLKRLAKTQSVSADQLEDQEAQLAMFTAQRDVARKQWEQALHLESKTRVLAPKAGRITLRHVSIGDYVTLGKPLFDLVSVNRLRARLAFPEHEAARVNIGKEVLLSSPAAPRAVAVGTVTAINPQISVHNRAIQAMVEFDNPGGWLPGASVDATIIVDQHEEALVVPVASVVSRGGHDVVFLLQGERVRPQR